MKQAQSVGLWGGPGTQDKRGMGEHARKLGHRAQAQQNGEPVFNAGHRSNGQLPSGICCPRVLLPLHTLLCLAVAKYAHRSRKNIRCCNKDRGRIRISDTMTLLSPSFRESNEASRAEAGQQG